MSSLQEVGRPALSDAAGNNSRWRVNRILAGAARQIIVLAATLVAVFPVYFMAVSAFKTKDQYLANKWGLPTQLFWDNFTTAFAGDKFLLRFGNSLLLTVASVALSMAIAMLAAYAFARMPFRGKRTLFSLVIALMVVPPVVMVVPMFVAMVTWGMINTYYGAILIYVGLLMPFSVYLLTNFFKTVPKEIIDAARMDGCGTFGVFRQIMLPLSAPALLTLVVVNSMWVWNELLIALIFLQRDELKTLMAGIASMRSRNYVDIPATMAGLLVATLPIVILYLAGQRYFIRGLVSGAVK